MPFPLHATHSGEAPAADPTDRQARYLEDCRELSAGLLVAAHGYLLQRAAFEEDEEGGQPDLDGALRIGVRLDAPPDPGYLPEVLTVLEGAWLQWAVINRADGYHPGSKGSMYWQRVCVGLAARTDPDATLREYLPALFEALPAALGGDAASSALPRAAVVPVPLEEVPEQALGMCMLIEEKMLDESNDALMLDMWHGSPEDRNTGLRAVFLGELDNLDNDQVPAHPAIASVLLRCIRYRALRSTVDVPHPVARPDSRARRIEALVRSEAARWGVLCQHVETDPEYEPDGMTKELAGRWLMETLLEELWGWMRPGQTLRESMTSAEESLPGIAERVTDRFPTDDPVDSSPDAILEMARLLHHSMYENLHALIAQLDGTTASGASDGGLVRIRIDHLFEPTAVELRPAACRAGPDALGNLISMAYSEAVEGMHVIHARHLVGNAGASVDAAMERLLEEYERWPAQARQELDTMALMDGLDTVRAWLADGLDPQARLTASGASSGGEVHITVSVRHIPTQVSIMAVALRHDELAKMVAAALTAAARDMREQRRRHFYAQVGGGAAGARGG